MSFIQALPLLFLVMIQTLAMWAILSERMKSHWRFYIALAQICTIVVTCVIYWQSVDVINENRKIEPHRYELILTDSLYRKVY